MVLTERSVEVLMGQLEDLDVPGTSRFTFNELLDESTLDISAVSNTVLVLGQKLLRYTGMDVSLNSNCSTLDEILVNIIAIYPRFNTKSLYPIYRALFHLCAQLQARRLVQAQSGSAQRIETVAAASKVIFQLVKICQNIDVDSSSAVAVTINSYGTSDTSAVLMKKLLSEVCAKVGTMQQLVSVSSADREPLWCGVDQLSTAQCKTLEDIQETTYQDYHRRRCMMLKRVDVTIQGFLWGENVAGKEGEIVAAIQAQRRELSEFPCKYSTADICGAPKCLLSEFTRSVSTSASIQRNKSLVKTLIIGAVPDRGGRVSESTMRNANLSSFGGGGGGGGGYKKQYNNNNSHHHSKGSKGGDMRSISTPGSSTGSSSSNSGGNKSSNNGNGNQNSGNARKKQKQDNKDSDRIVKFA